MFWTLSLLVTVVVLLLGYCHYRHQYWQSRGVYVPPTVPIIGHIHLAFSKKENVHDRILKIFQKTKLPYFGTYSFLKPVLFVRDLSILKHILVKDFDHFVDRVHIDVSGTKDELYGELMTVVSGTKWKALRGVVSPTFTSGKLKTLFPLIYEKCQRLSKWCLTEGTRRQNVEMKELFSLFTLDTIATTAFGVESNCIENKDDEFFRAALVVSKPPSKTDMLKGFGFSIAPRLFKIFGIRLAKPALRHFADMVGRMLDTRKENERRGDFLDLMMDAKRENEENSSKNKYPVTDQTIMAQSILFLLAGYDTTSTTLAFLAYVLARHPEVQERVREELKGLLDAHGEISYQTIAEAKFLDACLYESMRLYPASTATVRTCTKEYTIPRTDITLKEKMIVSIPIWTLNRDPEIWENPEAFKPERFFPENKTTDQTFAFHTFGQGPRNCVGMRFALLEVKLAMAHLLLNVELLLAPGHEGPLELKVGSGFLAGKDGINLAFRALQQN